MWERPDRSSESLRRHTLPHTVFHEICAGPASPDTIKLMRTTQYSRRKLQLRALISLASANPASIGPLTEVAEVWHLLVTTERQAPDIVEEVLMYPTVGSWLTRMVHRLSTGEQAATPLWTELGYLHSTVAAAAIRAAIPMSITVPVLHGAVNLPTVGHIRLPVAFPLGTAQLVTDRNVVRLQDPSFDVTLPADLTEPTTDYQPTRTHMSEDVGRVLRLRIEDTDPYRAFTTPRRPRRLSSLDIADWTKLIDEAWHVLSMAHGRSTEEISAGLTTIIPTSPHDDLLAASSPSGFGGMMLSANESPATMAELIVHELQHSKLNALLDLVTLLDEPGEATEYAPWREDPRPPIGLLHGIYAFTSAVEFHRVQRRHGSSSDTRRANYLFAHRRAQVREAINVARRLHGLTDLGQEFVDIVADRIDVCERDPVDADVLSTVKAMTADHRATWRMRHHQVQPEFLDRLWAAWSGGYAAPPVTSRSWTVQPDYRRMPSSQRESMTRLRLLDPRSFRALVRLQERITDGAAAADLAYTTGDHMRAADVYSARVGEDPHDWQSWIGLGLCAMTQGERATACGLLKFPAVVVALHDRIRQHNQNAADPIATANWVGWPG